MTGTFTTYDALAKKLTVNGTSGNDTIVISLSGGNTLSVSVNAVNDYNLGGANLASVLTLIEVQANGGNDSVNLGATTKAIVTATLINGGNGADTITGGAGADQIYGGAGNDSIDGNLGADSISGGADNDTVSYATRATAVTVNLDLLANDGAAGEGDWVGFGTTDVESIMGGAGNDVLTGNSLGNYISGGAGADMIHGSAGSDTMVGGAGGDSLYGDDDADFIFARDGEFDLIDGGPGIDSADVDSTPVEAPLPELPLPGALPSGKPAAVSAGAFSTRRVMGPIIATAPAPLPASDVENPITPATLPAVLQPLDPYTKGQALVTRSQQGVVMIGGTSLDDTFVFRADAAQGSIDIYNNGGLTQFFLPTPSLLLSGVAGSDSIDAGGALAGTVSASYKPDVQQSGAGFIGLDNHTITLAAGGAATIGSTIFTDLASLTYVTPQAHDVITLSGSGGKSAPTHLGGLSGNLTLADVTMDNVEGLTLDTGANDAAGNSDDVITTDVSGGAQLPPLSLLPGSSGKDLLQVGGPLALVNNPFKGGATPTLAIVTTAANSNLAFLATRADLASLSLPQGSAALAPGGDRVLVTKSLDLGAAAILDLTDNSLIVDFDGPPSPTPVIAGLIQSAYQPNAPTHWNGPGMTSSFAAGDASKGVGYANSSALFGPGGGNFMGVQVDDTATLVTFTLLGDANLDRAVGFPDLVKVAQNYGQSGARWISGDFDYDGNAGFSDLVKVAQNYGMAYP